MYTTHAYTYVSAGMLHNRTVLRNENQFIFVLVRFFSFVISRLLSHSHTEMQGGWHSQWLRFNSVVISSVFLCLLAALRMCCFPFTPSLSLSLPHLHSESESESAAPSLRSLPQWLAGLLPCILTTFRPFLVISALVKFSFLKLPSTAYVCGFSGDWQHFSSF